MKKFFFAAILLFLSFSLTAQQFTFVSVDTTYTLQHPSDWKVDTDTYGANNMASFESPKKNEKDRRGDALVTVSTQPLQKGVKTLEAAIKPQLNGLKKELKIKSFIENKRVKDKQMIVWQTSNGKVTLKSKTWMWIYEGRLYIAAYTAESQNYEANLKEGDKILQSIENL